MTLRTAVVTGGAGFIGSHLVDLLLGEGTRVVVIDDLSSGEAARVADAADLERVDVVDASRLQAVVDGVRPQVIFHLAAQSSVTLSVSDPGRDCAVNVAGTLNVLRAAERHGAPVVYASTGGALYGNGAPRPTDEHEPPAPLSPYGASKWSGEAYVTTWARAGGLPHAVCRPSNVYGPRQRPHGEAGVVSIFSYRLWRGEPPTVFGHGEPTRDYVHVSDVVEAMRRASGTPGVFNVATGVATGVGALLDLLQEEAGTSLEPRFEPLRQGELEHSCLNPARAESVLGWRAQVPLEEGVSSTYRALVADFQAEG